MSKFLFERFTFNVIYKKVSYFHNNFAHLWAITYVCTVHKYITKTQEFCLQLFQSLCFVSRRYRAPGLVTSFLEMMLRTEGQGSSGSPRHSPARPSDGHSASWVFTVHLGITGNRADFLLPGKQGWLPASWGTGLTSCFLGNRADFLLPGEQGWLPASWRTGLTSCFLEKRADILLSGEQGWLPASWGTGLTSCFLGNRADFLLPGEQGLPASRATHPRYHHSQSGG
jgi:hypothetical protein